MLEYHHLLVMSQANHLDSKLKRANQIQDKIKVIENNPEYISEENINVELKKTEEQISAALAVALKINEIKVQPNYLDGNQVLLLHEQVIIKTNIFSYFGLDNTTVRPLNVLCP